MIIDLMTVMGFLFLSSYILSAVVLICVGFCFLYVAFSKITDKRIQDMVDDKEIQDHFARVTKKEPTPRNILLFISQALLFVAIVPIVNVYIVYKNLIKG